jgi:hypothetical protein
MIMSYSETEREIVTSLTQLAKSLPDVPAGHGNWTREIIGNLAGLARRSGLQPCAHGCDHGEFLFDLVWLTRNGEALEGVSLVAECEWGTDQYVVADFEKLLLARADHRLLIFDGTNVHDADRLIERLRHAIHGFAKTRPGDRYLFAFWTAGGFQFRQGMASS